MDLEKDVIQIIDEKFPKMSKSHKAIARFIKEDYDQAVFMTAAKIGEKLYCFSFLFLFTVHLPA